MAPTPALTRSALTAALLHMGLRAGDNVIVHSSFRALGPVDGGPLAVLDALLDAIGPRGNLMLPTFNYTSPLPDPYFDPMETPARTGVIPELGRRRPGAIRSWHPTHSVAVIGPDAAELTAGHLDVRVMGKGSPIDKLAQRGGKVLLVGVGMVANTTIHIAEEHAGTPKVSKYDPLPFIKIRKPDGKLIEHQLDSSPSCSAGFEAAALPIRRSGALRDGRAGAALVQLMTGRSIIDAVVDLLRNESAALLCSNPDCIPCRGTRRNIERSN